MVVGEASINNIMDGIPNTGVRLHTYKKKLKQRFDIIKRLGQGTYGKVKLGINKETGQEVAIKTIKKSKIETEADLIRIRREIQIMSSVRHPNIVHIYEVFENREKMVLVMEYAAGGELYDYLSERKVLAEEEARRIFRQIAIACYYCHKHKICHRDLKLENILLDEEGNAKIADFGLSNVYDDTRLLSTFCGSPLYASPEIVKGTPYHGPEVDCWSLGVLLYTLVYGAMPFDGSNFKGLVKQISQGDYFEPRTPSPASPLIKEMLTVNPKTRADIEQICSHWWVNEGYEESALEISEYLANQTPVRLDYLLSLAPPPTKIEGDNLVVTGDVTEEPVRTDNVAPTRSQSVGSLMELTHPAEKRINDMLKDVKPSPKRKLESTVSTDQLNQCSRKDKIIKENTIADISVHATIHENASLEDASMSEPIPLDKSRTQTLSKEMDVEPTEDVSQQGAVCSEMIEEAKNTDKKKPVPKVKKTISTTLSPKKLEEINENPSQENLCDTITDKENKDVPTVQPKPNEVKESEVKTTPVKKKIKKVLTDKVENRESPEKKVQHQTEIIPEKEEEKTRVKEIKEEAPLKNEECEEMKQDEPETKPLERRRSRIYEQAEKFQNLITASESKAGVPEKPKKVVLPGVSVDGYKKQFERKCSLTSTSPPKTAKCSIPKRISIDKQNSTEKEKSPESVEKPKEVVDEPKNNAKKEETVKVVENNISKSVPEEKKEQLKNAVNVISSALEKDGARKSKSRPCIRKPPVPFGFGGRSASGSISMITSPLSPEESTKTLKVQIGPNNDTRVATVQVSTPELIKYEKPSEAESKTSSAEITLKSATLPRRKTTKAEIHLNYPQPQPASMEFKTEMAHRIEAQPKLATQRSEAVFPVAAAPILTQRSASVEPESKVKPKERIIPIAIEKQEDKQQTVTSPPPAVKPPTPKVLQNQKSYQSQRSNSLSRQSTQESDSETTVSGSGEPIRKSPREYIIPIAVEGGGYVTPRAGSLEPSDSTASTMTNSSRRSKLSRNVARRMNSLMSDRDGSEDESLFSLHRHSSFGRDSDNDESRKDTFPMHKLRSSRLRNLEHTDSVSSGEDDDDDGFDIMTSEKLFSSLLSRVKDLTQRINVDDRPGFPSSRLMSHFDRGNFWNFKTSRLDPFSSTTPLGRTVSQERTSNSSSSRAFGAPWRRSVSRDLATDIDSVLGESRTPTQTATLPRGDKKSKQDDLNLSDLDLKQLKLSEEDAIALSYLTPGLSRRIQKQLLAQLPPSEAKKLTRTMSMRNSRERTPVDTTSDRKSLDRNVNVSTLPRRYSVEPEAKEKLKRKDSGDGRPSFTRSTSLREPRTSYIKPETDSNNLEDSYKPNLYSTNDYVNLPRPSLYQSLYSPESSSLSKYLSPKHSETPRAYSPTFSDAEKKTDLKTPSTMPRKISRFLRPDFYDKPKDESAIVKEKKEREMETQKVLKEIRDKRKSRLHLRRERSASRETSKSESTESKELDKPKSPETKGILDRKDIGNGFKETQYKTDEDRNIGTIPKYANLDYDKYGNLTKIENSKTPKTVNNQLSPSNDNLDNKNQTEDTNHLLNNISDSIKTIETNIIAGHDYVNVPAPIEQEKLPKKVSRLVRPKSYPTDTTKNLKTEVKKELKKDPTELAESTSKVKIKKDAAIKTNEIKNKSPPKVTTVEKPSNKNRFLQSIEKKFEKLRGLNNGNSRENSVEKKTKEEKEKKSNIETAIKKLREQSLPRNIDHCITESGLIKRAVSVEDLSTLTPGTKELQPSRKSVTKILGLFKKYEEKDKKTDKGSKLKKPKESNADKSEKVSQLKSKKNGKSTTEKIAVPNKNDFDVNVSAGKRVSPEKPKENEVKERPKSMFYNIGNKIDDTPVKNSKLPVNSFRRSLNLDKPTENKTTKNKTEENGHDQKNNNTTEVGHDFNDNPKPDRRNLKLDLSSTAEITEGIPSTSSENRNSTATDDSSLFLSPCDDNMSCDSWSVCSDYHTNDLTSPISANGNLCSGDESESVIDRIRRKSFYTRFNEKKKPRKPSVSGNYRDLDLYKDYSQRKGYKTPTDYSSLDRRSVDYRFPTERRLSYSATQEPTVKKEYKPYGRSSSLLNDYVNVPNRYQTYNPRLTRHISSLYSPDAEDTVDNVLTAGKSRLSGYHYQPSRMNGRASSVSPSIDKLYSEMSPSSLKSNSTNSSSQMT